MTSWYSIEQKTEMQNGEKTESFFIIATNFNENLMSLDYFR